MYLIKTHCRPVEQKYKKAKKMSTPQKIIQTKLTKGLLDLIVLELIENHPMHGYQIITSIRKSFGIYFGPSTIYPLLSQMEKKQYLKCEWDMSAERPRKVYALTNFGKSMLDYTSGSLRSICKTIGTDHKHAHAEDRDIRLDVVDCSKNVLPAVRL